MWLGLVLRLLLFVTLVGVVSRSYGPGAGLTVLVVAIVTRGLLSRRRPRG